MQKNSKAGLILAMLAVALVLGGALGWLLSRQGDVSQVPLPQTSVSVQSKQVGGTNASRAARTQGDSQEIDSMGAEVPMAVSTNWEEKLDEVLTSDADDSSKAASILALMPQASEEGKVELAQHLANMAQDDNYTAVGDLLTNTNTSPEVASVLFNDLMNRGNKLKLPMLLAVARTENHPLRNDAKEMLEIFIQDDKGTNWDEWEKAINDWLKENEENTPTPPE